VVTIVLIVFKIKTLQDIYAYIGKVTPLGPPQIRWRKKMRGRRGTQEEHTKWSCLKL